MWFVDEDGKGSDEEEEEDDDDGVERLERIGCLLSLFVFFCILEEKKFSCFYFLKE